MIGPRRRYEPIKTVYFKTLKSSDWWANASPRLVVLLVSKLVTHSDSWLAETKPPADKTSSQSEILLLRINALSLICEIYFDSCTNEILAKHVVPKSLTRTNGGETKQILSCNWSILQTPIYKPIKTQYFLSVVIVAALRVTRLQGNAWVQYCTNDCVKLPTG